MKCNNCANRSCKGDHRQKCRGYKAPQSGWKLHETATARVMNWPTTAATMALGKVAR